MKGKHVFFYTLLLTFLVLSGTIPVKAIEDTFPVGHPGKHYKKLHKPAQNASDYGTQITFSGLTKWNIDWSPDGQWIAYEQEGDIFVISSEGGIPFNLTKSIEGYCYLPCFSADSEALSFTNWDVFNDIYTLEYIHLSGEGYTIISDDALAGYWSHNGRYLVFRIYSTSELALYDNETDSGKIIGEGDWEYGSSCFSPDDMYVITSMIASDNMPKLFRIPVEGGEPEQLTFHDGYHWEPEFSPDGKWIIYAEYISGMLYAYNTETVESQPVFTDSGNYVGRFSPEGDKICYLRDIAGINEVFVADFTSSPSTVTFPDPNLEAVIRSNLGKPTGPLTDEDLAKLTDLNASDRGISDLTGIEHCVNLQTLNLNGNQISDISPLSSLINIVNLDFNANQISELGPLSNLTNLQQLLLYDNHISDISILGNLTNLQHLELGINQISDLSPLSGIINLELLGLFSNQISDLSPLGGLTNLTVLVLSYNQISDLSPLGGLTNLTVLELFSNQISDFSPLSNLTNLQSLNMDGNQISDINHLVNMTNLRVLYLDNNQIQDISPLAGMGMIGDFEGFAEERNGVKIHFGLSENLISDISPLVSNTGIGEGDGVDLRQNTLSNEANETQIPALQARGVNVLFDTSGEIVFPDTNLEAAIREALDKPEGAITDEDLMVLTEFDASERGISDLTGIEHFVNLYSLGLGSNQISDISLLSNLTNLGRLGLFGNQINDISPLSNLTNLQGLWLGSNLISDISPLSILTNLQGLWMNDNQINDISSLVNLTNLRFLYLDQNQILDISPLAGLKMIGEEGESVYVEERDGVNIHLGLSNNQINDISPLVSNTGIGEGDGIDLRQNTLSDEAYNNQIPALQARGVNVLFDSPEPVTISDPNLEAAIRETLNKPEGPITEGDLAGLTNIGASTRDISDLTGIEHCVNLQWLNLFVNQIGDLGPLSNLTNLGTLLLNGNQISDLGPLSNLTNLNWLVLDDNQISDLSPLVNLTNLNVLGLGGNQIQDISPLAGLKKIGDFEWEQDGVNIDLGLSNNQINDISPLVNNTGIGEGDVIDLRENPLSTAAFTGIQELQERGVNILYSVVPEEPEITLVFKYQTNDLITFSSPAIGKDGTVYIGSNDYNLYAINPYGNLKWNRDLGRIWSSPAVTGDGTIYIGTLDGILYALDSNGNHKWNYTVDSAIFSSPAIANDGTIYFGSGEMFYAINADGSLKWGKNIGVIIYSSPAIGIDGTIYFGDENGSLYAYSPDGLQRWFARLGDYIYSSPAIGKDGTIYIGTSKYSVVDGVDRGFLYAVKPDGNVKWFSQPIGTYVESSPAIGQDGTIYVGSVGDGYLYALNHENGSIIWNYYTDNIYSSPAIGSDGTIYVGSDDWNLYAFSPDGDIKWSYETDSKIYSSPAIGNNGVIYVGSYDGYVYAIDSKTNAGLADSPWPKFRHDRRNSGRVFTEAQAYIMVTSPNGGEKLVPGEDFTITWSFSGVSNVRIEYSVDNAQNWITIGEVPASDGSFTWSIPESIDSSDCLVRITDTANTTVSDKSNNPFSISLEPYLVLTSQIGGEKLEVGSSFTIQWNYYQVSQITIKYSTDGGSTWKIINSNVNASDGSYTWSIPEDFSDNCKIMIADVSNPDIADESLGTFSIVSNEFITVTSPKFGDRWTAQSTKEITWEFSGVSNVKIELSVDNGTTWQTITASTSAASGSYSWVVPDIQKNQCIIKITDTANQNIYDTSDRFEIIKPELTINHIPITVARENDEITFNAIVSSEDSLQSVTLFYDDTGERNFLDLNNMKLMASADGSNYSVKLDIGVFTALGMEYFIQAKDINNRKTRAPADVGFYSISAQVSDIVSTEQAKGGSAQNAYRMISIPLAIDLSLKTIEDQLSGKLPSGESGTDWRLFRYSPGASTPDEYPDIESFSPGKAFWLITKNDFRLESPQGTTETTSKPFNITLKAGWNDIANPWMFDISWEDIENPSGADLSVLYTYNGSWSDPTTPPKKLEPWKGYTVNNLTNMNVIIKLNPKPASNAGKTVVKNDQIMWMLTVKAFAGEAKDTANHFGLRHGAMEEWDRYDHVEPPSIGEYVSVAFPHFEWEQYPYTYTVDFRPPSSKNLSWDFDVTTNISHENITIELDKIENLPEGYSYQVIDRDSDQNIRVSNEAFSFISGSGITERHFTIEVGDSITRDTEQYTSRPGKFVTAICYPNPFNPATTIQYELSQPGHVVISIFNSLGQRVLRYDIGSKEQGIHNFVFDATGMISGLYFYRVDSGYASATDKMLFMK